MLALTKMETNDAMFNSFTKAIICVFIINYDLDPTTIVSKLLRIGTNGVVTFQRNKNGVMN